MAERWDVFVSYAHEDEAWVRVLAENLHRAGRDVFFDQWEVVGGSRLSQRLQQGLESAEAVVFLGDLNVLEPGHQPHYKFFAPFEYDFLPAP